MNSMGNATLKGLVSSGAKLIVRAYALNTALFLAEKPAPKRRRTKQSKSSDEDPAFNPGASSGKGKEKATSDQVQLITRRSSKGGKLRDLMNMPVDIFTEVCYSMDWLII